MEKVRLKKQMRITIPAPNTTRRSYLASLHTSSGSFKFDGHPVCSTFLLKIFKFSRDLRRFVRRDQTNDGEDKNEISIARLRSSSVVSETENTVTATVVGKDDIPLEVGPCDVDNPSVKAEEAEKICNDVAVGMEVGKEDQSKSSGKETGSDRTEYVNREEHVKEEKD